MQVIIQRLDNWIDFMNTYLKFDKLTQLEAEGITSMPNAEKISRPVWERLIIFDEF